MKHSLAMTRASEAAALLPLVGEVQGFIQRVEMLAQWRCDDQLLAPRWAALTARPLWQTLALKWAQAQTLKPLISLYGPTGSGKSTLFRALTEIAVPHGGVRRPLTYACILGLGAKHSSATIASAFSGWQLTPLAEVDQLKRSPPTPQTVYYATIPATAPLAASHYLLGDVPDFDSAEVANQAQAEHFIRSALGVIFLCEITKYPLPSTLEQLRLCLETQGQLMIVVTKVSGEVTPAQMRADVRQHLLEIARERGWQEALLQRLESEVWWYFSPLRASPRLADIVAMDEAGRSSAPPSFEEIFTRLDNVELIRQSLVVPLKASLTLVEEASVATCQEATALDGLLRELEAYLRRQLVHHYQGKLPVALFFLIMQEELAPLKGWLVRATGGPTQSLLRWLSKRSVAGSQQPDAAIYRQVKADLQQHLQALADDATRLKLLPEFAADPTVLLATLSPASPPLEPPAVTVAMAEALRMAVRDWIEANDANAIVRLSLAMDMLFLGGGAAAVVDLFALGGVGFGVIAIPALSAFGGGAVGKLIETYRLGGVMQSASSAWQERRVAELHEHLVQHWLRPALADAYRRREALQHMRAVAAAVEDQLPALRGL